MTDTPFFQTASSWKTARALLTFAPLRPKRTAGRRLMSLRVHVRDHKRRDLPIEARTLEAHYGAFVFTQSRRPSHEARRLALDVPYGRDARAARIAGRNARIYELGPEPPPDDIDGRSPAVVTWHDGEMFLFIASSEWTSDVLVSIASSTYD
jgi:hypothetical protein